MHQRGAPLLFTSHKKIIKNRKFLLHFHFLCASIFKVD